MNKINELRTQRAKAWEKAQAFLTANRENGMLSEDNVKAYEVIEQEIVNLGHEIERQERLDSMKREMAAPVSTPITEKPESNKKLDTKKGIASDEYKKAFWNQVRSKNGISYDMKNALSEGVDSEGGYLVPDEFEHTMVDAMREESPIRELSHVFTTSNGVHKIPIVRTKGNANWIDEGGVYGDSDDVFGQEQIDAHKIGTIIKVSDELLNDSAFDLEKYFQDEFARRIGAKEEEAFIVGDGNKKPTGILNKTGGAEIGVNATSDKSITADEIIDLYYSLKAPYRKNAVWILNDSTVRAIRKLKDTTGQYLWQPALHEGEHETLMGKKIMTSPYVPELGAGKKVIMFGDFSFYWIGDRQGITFKRLNERYADMGQVGFLASKRVDGKLILPEAVKVLQMKGTASS